MNLVFFLPHFERSAFLTYADLQLGCGFSGTETALLEISRGLVQLGHQVTILRTLSARYETEGVRIVPWDDRQLIEWDAIDYYCPIFYPGMPESQELLGCLSPARTWVWVWMQCFVSDSDLEAIRQRGFRVACSHLSKYASRHYAKANPARHVVIGNAVSTLFTTPVAFSRKGAGRWVFHATFERGGAVAERVFRRVRELRPDLATELHFASYYLPDAFATHSTTTSGLIGHGSLSKSRIVELLDDSDFFVYPLVLESSSIHHDTYGSAILEALARGVTVVTWDVACNRDVYGDQLVLAAPLACPGYEPQARFGSNHRLKSDEAVELLATRVSQYGAQSDEDKLAQRRHASDWAQQQTWASRVHSYNKWLSDLLLK